MVKVLFVCMGNICRSPMAEGILRRNVADAGIDDAILVDSAGTHGYHAGSPPDRRSIDVARRRGVDLEQLRARRVMREDFSKFHYLLAMDQNNHRHLVGMCNKPDEQRKISLFLEYSPDMDLQEVPDPYYGDADGFERTMDLLERGMKGLISHVRRCHRL